MNAITSLYLRARHWQLFVCFAGLCVVICLMNGPLEASLGNPRSFEKAFLVLGCLIALTWLCFALWLWSIGSFCNSVVSPPLRLRLRLFRFAAFFPVVTPLLFGAVFCHSTKPLFMLLMVCHPLSMLCMVYDLYFVSKSFALAVTGKPVTLYEYAGPLFLIGYFPLGIWYIQPRVNAMFEKAQQPGSISAVTPD